MIIRNNCLTCCNCDVPQSNMGSPYTIHQQQLAFISQQQAFLVAASQSGSALPAQKPGTTVLASNSSFPIQNWPKEGNQFPGMTLSAGEEDNKRLNQVIFSIFFNITWIFVSYFIQGLQFFEHSFILDC